MYMKAETTEDKLEAIGQYVYDTIWDEVIEIIEGLREKNPDMEINDFIDLVIAEIYPHAGYVIVEITPENLSDRCT